MDSPSCSLSKKKKPLEWAQGVEMCGTKLEDRAVLSYWHWKLEFLCFLWIIKEEKKDNFWLLKAQSHWNDWKENGARCKLQVGAEEGTGKELAHSSGLSRELGNSLSRFIQSLLEARQNPSCGILHKQEFVTWDKVWTPGIPLWVLRKGQKSLLCLDRCHCPGIAFDPPARCFSRKTNQNKSQGILCTATNTWNCNQLQRKQLEGFLLRQGRNPFLVTARIKGILLDFHLRKQGSASPKRPKEQHILEMEIKIPSANTAQL